MGPVPRTGALVACPTTGKQYAILGPADEVWPGQFKLPSNIKRGTRLWVLCGFELGDHPVMKTTEMLRVFHRISPGWQTLPKAAREWALGTDAETEAKT